MTGGRLARLLGQGVLPSWARVFIQDGLEWVDPARGGEVLDLLESIAFEWAQQAPVKRASAFSQAAGDPVWGSHYIGALLEYLP